MSSARLPPQPTFLPTFSAMTGSCFQMVSCRLAACAKCCRRASSARAGKNSGTEAGATAAEQARNVGWETVRCGPVRGWQRGTQDQAPQPRLGGKQGVQAVA